MFSEKKSLFINLINRAIFRKVDAFVAMGGNSDKSGTVDATELIKTIKDEFKMTIDIEVKTKILIHALDFDFFLTFIF